VWGECTNCKVQTFDGVKGKKKEQIRKPLRHRVKEFSGRNTPMKKKKSYEKEGKVGIASNEVADGREKNGLGGEKRE